MNYSLINIKKIILFSILICLVNFTYGQSHISTQAHENEITQIVALDTGTKQDDSFFSAGEDGFLIKWTQDKLGEHYQLSEFQIKMIARSPNGTDIAVYETDGVSVNRVSVWNWKTFTRKYAKRFTDTITSIAYSEKGTYLIIGTSAVNGVYFLNSTTGSVVKRPSDTPSIVSLIKTGASEKSVVFYSPSGSLVYYDLLRNKVKAKFTTESGLQQPVIFGTGDTENCFLAGIKNSTIFIIAAFNGKTIAQYPSKQSLLFCSNSKNETGLYFTSFDGKEYLLEYIENDTLKNQLTVKGADILNPPAPLIIKNFIGPKNSDTFTTAAKTTGTILLGTKSGNIYTLNTIPESEKLTIFPISEKMYEKINDISSDSKDFYFLTNKSIYKSSYETGVVDKVGINMFQTNFIKYKDGAILWSKESNRNIQYLSLSSGSNAEAETLIVPQNNVQNVRLYGDKVIYIQGNSSVGIYDIQTRSNSIVYNGTALQDAVLYNDTDLYVSKTATIDPATPLILVNIDTKETVPLRVSGTISYSLSYDDKDLGSPIYGITVSTVNDKITTKVFSFLPNAKTLTNLLQLSDEDPNAFTYLNYPILYTNIGKSNVRAYNLQTKSNYLLKRSASMPLKVQSTEDTIAVLNRDGSISWYNTTSPNVLADWYLTTDGQWFEF